MGRARAALRVAPVSPKETTWPRPQWRTSTELLEVQALDTRIAQANHRKVHLPVRAERRPDPVTACERSPTARSRPTQRCRPAAGGYQGRGRRPVGAGRADRDNARLNSGAGMTPKDLQAIQGELEALAKRQADLEEVELDAMQRLEDAEATAARQMTSTRD